MKSETRTQSAPEQNNCKPRDIQKIEAQILFGKAGPWSKYFKALMAMGINVQKLYEVNAELKDQLKIRERIVQIEEDRIAGLKERIIFLQNETIGQYTPKRTYAPHLRILRNEV